MGNEERTTYDLDLEDTGIYCKSDILLDVLSIFLLGGIIFSLGCYIGYLIGVASA